MSDIYMEQSLYNAEDELDELGPDGEPLDIDDKAAVTAADQAWLARRQWLLYADTADLLLWWEAYEKRHNTLRALERGEDTDGAQAELDRYPQLTALRALEANRKLVHLLTLRRWYVMQDAREAGATWSQIGDALGVTKQGAHDWYRRTIATMAADLEADGLGAYHDGARAEQAL